MSYVGTGAKVKRVDYVCQVPQLSAAAAISLSEAMVSLLILTIVMIVALTLLFSMKSFAERQQVKTAPRQTSRRAIDYLAPSSPGRPT